MATATARAAEAATGRPRTISSNTPASAGSSSASMCAEFMISATTSGFHQYSSTHRRERPSVPSNASISDSVASSAVSRTSRQPSRLHGASQCDRAKAAWAKGG